MLGALRAASAAAEPQKDVDMGQYWIVVNKTKREFLNPDEFGDGIKLMEFGRSGDGTTAALAVLLARGNGRGGGDCRSSSPLIGSWAGDHVEIAGDYGDETEPGGFTLYSVAEDTYRDISGEMKSILEEDESGTTRGGP